VVARFPAQAPVFPVSADALVPPLLEICVKEESKLVSRVVDVNAATVQNPAGDITAALTNLLTGIAC
jgi:hypothetical protein